VTPPLEPRPAAAAKDGEASRIEDPVNAPQDEQPDSQAGGQKGGQKGGHPTEKAQDPPAAAPAGGAESVQVQVVAQMSRVFIERPVATALLTIAVALAGILAYLGLPVSPLPQVDFPTISVSAQMPGASPETMASTIATPLERALGRIAGVTEITSNSTLGNTRVTLQFEIGRSINAAAREVQAAINASRSQLPSGLPSSPTYRKVNPAEAPILILSLTSPTMSQGQMYDAASSVLAQALSQVPGVGQVNLGGSSLPAVRVELDPQTLNATGLTAADVRNAIAATNTFSPKGVVDAGDRQWQVETNDQARKATEYIPLIVGWRQAAPVRLSDVADVQDSVQDLFNAGTTNGRPSIIVVIYRQPGANIIETVDRVYALLPQLRAAIPQAIELNVALDRTPTIRASLHEVERTLVISVALVVMVVLLFLRNFRAALIPSVAVPVSLAGTFCVMWLCGYSLNNLSLMALTIATGFVVDDAVVVLENASRHIEAGITPVKAALLSVREVGFTVLSMSLSLVAVFLPILLMGGLIGRYFREFALTLSAAIAVSLVVSLTTTPTMCARLLRAHRGDSKASHGADAPTAPVLPARGLVAGALGWVSGLLEGLGSWLFKVYARSLDWALNHRLITLGILAATVALNVWLYVIVPKGFMPQQDTGRLFGYVRADQQISFQAMREKLAHVVQVIRSEPAVEVVVTFTGGSGSRNAAQMFVALKPLSVRGISAEAVLAKLRRKLAHEPGTRIFLQAVQDFRVGGRQSDSAFEYTLQSDELAELARWEPKVRDAMVNLPELVDVSTDSGDRALQTTLTIDRDAAYALGINQTAISAALNDLFGQRVVSTIYNPLNQYRVVMEAAPRFWQGPEGLDAARVATPSGHIVPLSQIAQWRQTQATIAVNHQSQFASTTVSFGLAPGVSMSQAVQAIERAMVRIHLPNSVMGSFQGTAKAFNAGLSTQPLLILAAIVAIYIVLGMLYESLVHPLTILSTLPSAGVGALLALLATDTDFSLIALIGVILLIGIVKKNAIMMVDFALEAERTRGLDPQQAIREACLLRIRPIMMTTLAALFGALPLAIGFGEGKELRTPLGISIVGGLVLSQLLTLYTTPVVYLVLDRARLRWSHRFSRLARLFSRRSAPTSTVSA
jgi:multidrug efflux pump